jgi:hypothetical protein
VVFYNKHVAEMSTRNDVLSAKTYDSPITVGRLNALSKYPREVTRSTGNCDNLRIRLLIRKLANDCLKLCTNP